MGLLQAVAPSEPLGLSCLQDGKGQVWAGALFWGRTLSPGAPGVILPGVQSPASLQPWLGGGVIESPSKRCPSGAWAAEWDRVVLCPEPGCQAARTAGFLYRRAPSWPALMCLRG